MTLPPERDIEGGTVRLRPFTDAGVLLTHRWLNDRDVVHWLHLSEESPERLAGIDFHAERWRRRRADPAARSWIIETPGGEPVGSAGLEGIHATHLRAELWIVIGDTQRWGGGLGTDAVRALLGFAFGEMGLRRVWLITDADNARAIRCFEKSGFVREGLLRSHRLRYGKPIDMLTMAVLREEWEKVQSGGE
jgi:RimJ/RimL family protein N-acetyltransferase